MLFGTALVTGGMLIWPLFNRLFAGSVPQVGALEAVHGRSIAKQKQPVMPVPLDSTGGVAPGVSIAPVQPVAPPPVQAAP